MFDKYRLSESRFEERSRINARRVRDGWGEFLNGFEWEQFVTLTTDPMRFRHPSNDRLSREVHRFCDDLARLSRFHVGWTYAVEGGGGRSLHAHVLTMKATKPAHRAALLGWQARNGTTHRREIDDIRAAVGYLCKSIGPNGEVVFSDSLLCYRPRTASL
jgi:hypothetical protein